MRDLAETMGGAYDADAADVDIVASLDDAGAVCVPSLETFPAHAWDKVLDLKLKSPFYLTRALLPCPQRPPRTTRRGW